MFITPTVRDHHLKHSLLEKGKGAIGVKHFQRSSLLVSDSQGGTERLPQEADVLLAGLAAPGGDVTHHRGHQGPQAVAIRILTWTFR